MLRPPPSDRFRPRTSACDLGKRCWSSRKAARYLELPGTWVLPVALTGTDHLFPLNEGSLNPVCLTLAIGPPLAAADLELRAGGDRQQLMDAVGRAIAQQLKPEYRGFYQT